MAYSMTGFARVERDNYWGSLSCEIRSVNHRYLELSFRLPDNLRASETRFRDVIKACISRGKIEVSFFLHQQIGVAETVDNEALAHLSSLVHSVNKAVKASGNINPLEILRWPGILQSSDIDSDELKFVAEEALNSALDELVKHRAREGKGLQQLIIDRLQAIQTHVVLLREQMPELIKAQQEKLAKKIEALQVEVDQDRLAQELVIIAQKADIAEELDRIETHIIETELTLKKSEAIGRRLDFLMQEFNREANTLSSKAIASGVTQSAVELKVLIEQMREQIQNIE